MAGEGKGEREKEAMQKKENNNNFQPEGQADNEHMKQ